MSFNQFAPFDESSIVESNVFRTFEELITERGEINSTSKIDYTILFDKIKSKLNNINLDFEFDVNIEMEYTENVLAFKKSICDIYLNFMHSDNALKNAREKFTNFSENIQNCLTSIISADTEYSQDDITLKSILNKKIENYYTFLDIDTLVENYNKNFKEFERVKYKTSLLVGSILPTTICQICLENQVDYFIDPCGHTICKNCKLVCENKTTSCHYCRTQRKSYKRLYL